MDALYLILYVLAAVLFLLAAVWERAGSPRPMWNSLVALGLMCWVLVPLITKARSM